MRIDFDRLTPVGVDGKKEGAWLLFSLGAAAVWNFFGFVLDYGAELNSVPTYIGGSNVEVLSWIRPFSELNENGCLLYWYILALSAVLTVVHYAGHFSGSKSIYLMRRLPDRWELHRRCLALPVLTAVTAMVLVAVQTGLHYLIYTLCTPEQYL